MKRIGQLFERTFTCESLYAAYRDACKGKRGTRACFQFERRLGPNLENLYQELNDGRYTPRPYYCFTVYEPKQRLIYAPAFRDLVVQHAIYRVVGPIFDRSFIDQSFACRKGRGTHKAADYAQDALRASQPDSYVLKLDIRKFFYRIDRAILRGLIERKVKDERMVNLMMRFADHGEPVGIPIGNLLSQLYALIYLNPLDHFIKRDLKISRYTRYVDDFVLFGITLAHAKECLGRIIGFLADIKLELSRYTLSKVARGINFVGYRTWRTTALYPAAQPFQLPPRITQWAWSVGGIYSGAREADAQPCALAAVDSCARTFRLQIAGGLLARSGGGVMIDAFQTKGTTGPGKQFSVPAELMDIRVARTATTSGEGFTDLRSLYVDFHPASHSATRFREYAAQRELSFYMPQSTFEKTLAQFEENNIEGIAAAPNGLLALIRAGLRHKFKHIIASSAPLTATASIEIREALGDNLWHGYGNSGVGGKICIGRAIDTTEQIPGCVGHPCADVQLKIIDGVIWVKVPGQIISYAHPAANKGRFNDGWFNTDDRGSLTDDGRVVIEPRQTKLPDAASRVIREENFN